MHVRSGRRTPGDPAVSLRADEPSTRAVGTAAGVRGRVRPRISTWRFALSVAVLALVPVAAMTAAAAAPTAAGTSPGSGAPLSAGAPLGAAVAQTTPPSLCGQALAAVDALPAPPVLRPGAPVTVDERERELLDAAGDALARLSRDRDAALACEGPLAERAAARSQWAAALVIAAGGAATDGAGATAPGTATGEPADLVALADALRPLAATPAACETAGDLVAAGDFELADLLLRDLLASPDPGVAGCAAEGLAELRQAQLAAGDPVAVGRRLLTRYGDGVGDVALWSVVAAAVGLLLGRAVAPRALRPASRALGVAARTVAVVAGVSWLLTAGSLLLVSPDTPDWATGAYDRLRAAAAGVPVLDTALAGVESSPGTALLILVGSAGLATLAWAGAPQRERLTVGEFVTGDVDAPPAFLGDVTTELWQLTTAPPQGVDLIAGSDLVSCPVEGVRPLPASRVAAALVAVWRSLGSGRVLTVAGSARVDEGDVRAVSITLRRGRRVQAALTLDSRLFLTHPDGTSLTREDVAAAWADLATGVAAWLLWETYPARLRDADPRLYGARSWRAVALAAVAARRAQVDPHRRGAGDTVARALLARAIEEDPGYRAAAFGLLNRRAREIHPGTPDVLARVDAVVDELAALAERQRRAGDDLPLYWRLQYALGAAVLNRAAVRRSRQEPEHGVSEQVVTMLEELRHGARADRALHDGLARLARPVALGARRFVASTDPDPEAASRRARGLASWARRWLALSPRVRRAERLRRRPLSDADLGRQLTEAGMTPREAFNYACALLSPRLLPSGADERERLAAACRSFAVQQQLVDRALSTDPFFALLRSGENRDDLQVWLGLPPAPVREDSAFVLLAAVWAKDALSELGLRTLDALRAAHERGSLPSLLTAEQAQDLDDSLTLLDAGASVGHVNLVHSSGLTTEHVLSAPVERVQQHLVVVANALRVEPPSTADVTSWRAAARRRAGARAAAAPDPDPAEAGTTRPPAADGTAPRQESGDDETATDGETAMPATAP